MTFELMAGTSPERLRSFSEEPGDGLPTLALLGDRLLPKTRTRDRPDSSTSTSFDNSQ